MMGQAGRPRPFPLSSVQLPGRLVVHICRTQTNTFVSHRRPGSTRNVDLELQVDKTMRFINRKQKINIDKISPIQTMNFFCIHSLRTSNPAAGMVKPAWLHHYQSHHTSESNQASVVATSNRDDQASKASALSWKETTSDIVASIVGSAACTYTGQPFDTMKVRLQVNPNEFSGIIPSLKKTISGEGIAALWKGSVPAMVGALSENIVAFATNGMLKRILQSHSDDSLTKPLLSGAITGALSSLVLCPCDILKCRAQVNIAMGLSKQSMTKIIKDIIKKDGFRGLYLGFGPQLIRDVPFYASFFGTYDILCALMKKYTSLPETSIYFIAGGIAGQVGWAISIAPDTIKSRIQVSDNPQSFMVTARQIIAENGVRGLFAGIEVAIIRAFPANAALFVGYEWSRKLVSNILE